MRFTLPTRRPASPVPPQPRQPPPQAELRAELDVEESPQPIAGARRVSGRVVTAVAAVAAVLLCAGIGMTTDVEMLKMGSGADRVSTPKEADRAAANRATADRAASDRAAADRAAAERAAADRAAADRAAEDRAMARKVAAAKAADAEAAAARAARARAAQVAATRTHIVAMPALVGLKLDIAMDVAADAGLTAVAVCRTPDGDTPLWWANWRVTGQDVPPGTRVSAERPICVAATK